MKNSEIRELVQKKRFLIESFLVSMSLKHEENNNSTLGHAVTCHFLQSVVLELTIKALFELDCKKIGPRNHNIIGIFKALGKDTQNQLTFLYREAMERHKQQFSHTLEGVHFHSLETILANNEATIKNFKYDAIAKSNSLIDDIFMQEVFAIFDKKTVELDR